MRLLVRLEAQADAAYDTSYHHKLRGRLWRAFEGTAFDDEHDDPHPRGWSFSNIFPWGSISEGDARSVLIASAREPVLAAVAEDLRENPEFNVGEMAFSVTELSSVDPDVGEPGTRGTIETSTGVFVRLFDAHREQYGIESEHEGTPTYWRPEHTVEPFKNALEANLQHKHDQFAPEYLPGPADVDGDLFDGYDLIKTYALPVTVTEGTEIEAVVSKWRFEYRVRDDHHRRHLNLALDTGVGGRNALGFGFVNVVDRTRPGETELEVERAFP